MKRRSIPHTAEADVNLPFIRTSDRFDLYEFKEMYPAFIPEAEKEGNRAAVISFRNGDLDNAMRNGRTLVEKARSSATGN